MFISVVKVQISHKKEPQCRSWANIACITFTSYIMWWSKFVITFCLYNWAYLHFSPDNLFANCITVAELTAGLSIVSRDGRFLTTDSVNATYRKINFIEHKKPYWVIINHIIDHIKNQLVLIIISICITLIM